MSAQAGPASTSGLHLVPKVSAQSLLTLLTHLPHSQQDHGRQTRMQRKLGKGEGSLIHPETLLYWVISKYKRGRGAFSPKSLSSVGSKAGLDKTVVQNCICNQPEIPTVTVIDEEHWSKINCFDTFNTVKSQKLRNEEKKKKKNLHIYNILLENHIIIHAAMHSQVESTTDSCLNLQW